MNIVVLAGGLSTERDVSFKTGDMVSKALRENGHNVILLDVFMGYSDKEENLTGIFDRTEEVSVQEKISRTASSDRMSSTCAAWRILFSWHYTEKTARMVRFRQHLTCLGSNIPEPAI